MTDPAIEATRRAIDGRHGSAVVSNPRAALLATTAAREALAPLRELHAKNVDPCSACSTLCVVCANECAHCDANWPCATAKLIYRTEEL